MDGIRIIAGWVGFGVLVGCAVEAADDPFDVAGQGAPGIPQPDADADEDDEDDGDESSTTDPDLDASTDETAGSSESSGAPEPVSDDASGSTSAPPLDDGGVPPDGTQPVSGMYAHCLDAAGCVGVEACFQALDGVTMAPIDGFCTTLGCANPMLDCDPSPGGTATPVCYASGANLVCALDCAGGGTCPTGMVCTTFADASLCV